MKPKNTPPAPTATVVVPAPAPGQPFTITINITITTTPTGPIAPPPRVPRLPGDDLGNTQDPP